jgi:hypothetical protein
VRPAEASSANPLSPHAMGETRYQIDSKQRWLAQPLALSMLHQLCETGRARLQPGQIVKCGEVTPAGPSSQSAHHGRAAGLKRDCPIPMRKFTRHRGSLLAQPVSTSAMYNDGTASAVTDVPTPDERTAAEDEGEWLNGNAGQQPCTMQS